MTDNDRMLIHIPKDGEYIEILGHRIDGFDSFQAFCEYLKKFAEMEETINRQKETIEQLQTALFKCGEEMAEKQATISRRMDEIDMMFTKFETIAAEAVKEFAERLKKEVDGWYYDFANIDDTMDALTDIDNLVKEFTEGDQHVGNT